MPRSLAAAAILATLVLASGAQSGTLTSRTQPTASFNRFALDSSAAFPNVARTARRHGFVVLQAWQRRLARRLKAASPTVKVLAYKNLSFVVCDSYSGQRYVPQGVRCGDAKANHPDWFLADSSGKRLNSSGYPRAWLMDVGSPSYQAAWAESVIAEAKADGWDGVFMDDTNSTLRYHFDTRRVARYPTDAAWTAATRSMLAAVGPRIRDAGLLAVANVCCARLQTGIWKDWLPFLSGALEEMFTKWGNHPSTGYVWDWGADGWSAQLEQVREAEAQGKYFLGVAHSRGNDARAATYGLATMLLAAEGRSSFSLAHNYTNETWFAAYDRAARLRRAAGPYSRLGPVYRRDFAGGAVLVNPSHSTVHLELGAPYVTTAGAAVRSLALAPTTATILLATRRPTVQLAVVATRRGRRPVLRLRLHGRLVAASPTGGRRVTIVRKTRAGWKAVGRVRTGPSGGFRLSRRLRVGARVLRLRAVTAHSGMRLRSGVLTVRIRRR